LNSQFQQHASSHTKKGIKTQVHSTEGNHLSKLVSNKQDTARIDHSYREKNRGQTTNQAIKCSTQRNPSSEESISRKKNINS
jgi:hypothetical protein